MFRLTDFLLIDAIYPESDKAIIVRRLSTSNSKAH